MGCVPVICGEVPGEDALGDEVAPGEVAVAALPGVAEDAEICRDFFVPAEVDSVEGLGFGANGDREAVWAEGGANEDAGGLGFLTGDGEGNFAGVFSDEGGGTVGGAEKVDVVGWILASGRVGGFAGLQVGE